MYNNYYLYCRLGYYWYVLMGWNLLIFLFCSMLFLNLLGLACSLISIWVWVLLSSPFIHFTFVDTLYYILLNYIIQMSSLPYFNTFLPPFYTLSDPKIILLSILYIINLDRIIFYILIFTLLFPSQNWLSNVCCIRLKSLFCYLLSLFLLLLLLEIFTAYWAV